MQLDEIFVHPLKSGRGISYSQAYADQPGLLHDREWLLVDEAGRFITARTHPQMVRIQTELLPGAALFRAPGKDARVAMTCVFDTPVHCTVWGDDFVAYHGDPGLDDWFSGILEQPCRLLWLGTDSTRRQKDVQKTLSFADGYPYLLINLASLQMLNQSLATPVGVRNFRPNLVISGAAPFQEDEWTVLRIGKATFEVTKPCSRCVLTTVDPQTGLRDENKEPLKTLMATRRLPEGVCFGINLRARDEGVIKVGDAVEVLESRYEF